MVGFLQFAIPAAFAAVLGAQVRLMPLAEVKPGMRGTGKTVFSGSRVEEFGVEILGVLENAGPRQSIILAKLSGGPLESTGVMQGMSGSPVYINGRLAGAVAMAFAFSKEPIAGIRPIEEMLAGQPAPPRTVRASLFGKPEEALLAYAGPPAGFAHAGTRLVEIATPVSFSGFTGRTIEVFAPGLRALGLEPRQGMAGGAAAAKKPGTVAALTPGSMISVQLVTGDLNIGADGTVTHVDGKRVYAFGHRFLSIGPAEMPFAEAEVLTLLPNLNTSFKISAARGWLGAITADYSTAVSGELGRKAALAPVTLEITGRKYDMEMVVDRVLSPFLLQMAVFSAIDAAERTVGAVSFRLNGTIEFQGEPAPVKIDNIYAGDFNVPLQAALGVAAPLAYAMQSDFESMRLKRVALTVDTWPEKRLLQIEQAWTSKRTVRPGETVDVMVLLAGDRGVEQVGKASYQVPVGAPVGTLYFTVADGMTTNLAEFRQTVGAPQKSPRQVMGLLNGLRGNSKAYVRVWRAQPSYQVQGEDLPDPPPSAALILAKAQTPGLALAGWGSKVAELEIGAGEVMISGSRTVQVEVKE